MFVELGDESIGGGEVEPEQGRADDHVRLQPRRPRIALRRRQRDRRQRVVVERELDEQLVRGGELVAVDQDLQEGQRERPPPRPREHAHVGEQRVARGVVGHAVARRGEARKRRAGIVAMHRDARVAHGLEQLRDRPGRHRGQLGREPLDRHELLEQLVGERAVLVAEQRAAERVVRDQRTLHRPRRIHRQQRADERRLEPAARHESQHARDRRLLRPARALVAIRLDVPVERAVRELRVRGRDVPEFGDLEKAHLVPLSVIL
jgi:hypothetical protein